MRLLPLWIVLAVATLTAPAMAQQQCPDNYAAFKDEPTPLACTCPAEATQAGSVFGTDVYTSDSSVCRAALHAGIVTRRGGPITVETQPGRRSYYGTTRNGLSSSNYGEYESSFRFVTAAPGQAAAVAAATPAPTLAPTPAPAAAAASTQNAAQQCPDNFVAFKDEAGPVACTCPASATGSGSVWGTDHYTADTAICRAALHAGVIGSRGGQITVVGEAGRAFYFGAMRNGVRSTNYGPFESGYRFEGATIPTAAAFPADAGVCPDNFAAFKDQTEPMRCSCPAETASSGSVWGTDVYTADTALCRAAVHAGMITGRGGVVTVVPEPGRRSYPGITRNGVRSDNYGEYESSFRFDGKPATRPTASAGPATVSQCPDNYVAFKDDPTPLTCICPAEATQSGSVWGTDVYTADSALCRSALHAGAVGRLGGQVTVTGEPGRNAYPGTTRNGLSSSNYARYESSFRIAGSGVKLTAPVQASVGDSLRASGKVNLYIQFRTGSADLDISSAAVLNELLAVMRDDPTLKLRLIGHTDSTGSRATNGPLSVRRAEAVRAWLSAQGVDAARLVADGRGQEEPIAPNTTEDGKALNRRVQAAKAS